MAVGDFESAWRISDRVQAGRLHADRDNPATPYHQRWVWDGRALEGRRVLVRCYHGLGDTLQFCRFLTPLRARASHLTIEAQPELTDLLKTIGSLDDILPFDPAKPSPRSECDIEIMELQHALRAPPTCRPYLRAPERRQQSGLRVGLCWQSSPTWLSERSMPPELATTILRCAGVNFVNLQLRGASLPGLENDCPTSIVETANRIAGLDLVLSVDTMVAHLTGALGIPLWLFLKADPDWRWLAGGRRSLWYERVRKYRQPTVGDWVTPIQAALADLEESVRSGTLQTREGFQR